MKKDELGIRMKENYENRTRYFLPRRSYTMIRVDGKAFHTYTRGLNRPFDQGLIEDMDATAMYLCENIMGAKFAFVQSDEISVLITDFEQINTQAWFDNNLQKMCSVSASLATAKFNQLRLAREAKIAMDLVFPKILAMFDSRVWQIPQRSEVENYLIWRQQDTVRNSISSVAQSMFSHKELHQVNTNQMQDMIFKKSGINWNDYDAKLKRGRIIIKKQTEVITNIYKTQWVSEGAPHFTQEREWFVNNIPINE